MDCYNYKYVFLNMIFMIDIKMCGFVWWNKRCDFGRFNWLNLDV